IINNIPLQLSDTIIPIDVEVNDIQGYAIIAGVNWLNKVQGIIDLKRGQFKFTWDNKSYILPITYWEKPQYNNSKPISLKNSSESNDSNNQTSSAETNSSEISKDEYESSDDEQKESKGFLVIENSDEKSILEINNTQVKYQNESFNNYNFYCKQTSDPRVVKYHCNQLQKTCSKCIQVRETISCFATKEDLEKTNLSSINNLQL
ncbi:6272_t:CDS:1, partial [Racocetra fulgida]